MRKMVAMSLGMVMALSLTACGSAGGTGASGADPSGADPSGAGEEVTADGVWPDKAITLLCGYAAGGSSDLGCRYVAEALRKDLGVPVVVENVPGSASWLAWNQLLHSEPDGYTFALINLSALYGHYDEVNPRETTIDDFELLANHVIDYQVIAIRSDETRFTDYPSLIQYAQENTVVTAGASTGITSGDAAIAKMLEKDHGCKITVIPVDGSSDSTTMLVAGETDIMFGNVADVMEGEANGYRPIVIFAPERSSFLPDVPTAIETGEDDYVSFSARGFAYMPGVDQEIVDRMTEALITSFDDEEYQERMAAMGAQMELYSGEEYEELLKGQLDVRLELFDAKP